jgi:hypothetical protein
MKQLTVILVFMMLIASCSQITTNKNELSTLETTANNSGDDYVACVVNYSLEHTSANAIDVATAIKLATQACETDLTQFKNSQNEYLSAQFIMTKKPLQASIDALNERATMEVGEALLSETQSQATAVIPVAAGSAAIVTSTPPPAFSSEEDWSSEQQAYLDCMEEQAHKYAGLNESASVIADVAQGRCKSYMAGPGSSALEQEGRAMVMGVVLDAKLDGSDHQSNE